MKSPKRREIISFVFTCLCITKSLLLLLSSLLLLLFDSQIEDACEEYFEQQSSKCITSDHTLSKLSMPRMDQQVGCTPEMILFLEKSNLL